MEGSILDAYFNARESFPIRCGERLGSMENSSSSASISDRRAWPSTWSGDETRGPRLEDVPPKSCRRHRRDGSVRRADNLISSALRLVDCGAWSTADFMAWRHSASDRRMDRKSDHGSMRVGTGSPRSHSPPRRRLWGGLHPQTPI